MAIKVVVDRTKCSSIGICESIAPDIFEVGADGVLQILLEEIPGDRRAEVEQACADCPTQALSIQE